MKRVMLVACLSVLIVAVAACGGANNASLLPSNAPANGEHHEDDHGKMTDAGSKKIGGRDVEVEVNAFPISKGEGVAEVGISGEGVDKLAPKTWLTDTDGKEVSPKKEGEWRAHEKKFDCHVELNKSLKPGKYKLWIQIGDAKESWDVELHG